MIDDLSYQTRGDMSWEGGERPQGQFWPLAQGSETDELVRVVVDTTPEAADWTVVGASGGGGGFAKAEYVYDGNGNMVIDLTNGRSPRHDDRCRGPCLHIEIPRLRSDDVGDVEQDAAAECQWRERRRRRPLAPGVRGVPVSLCGECWVC